MIRRLKALPALLWQSSAEKRHSLVGPANLWKMKRDFQIRFLKEIGMVPTHFLLDLGCGTLRGGIPVIATLDPGRYYGVDVRPEVLAEARRELRDAGLEHKEPVLLARAEIPPEGLGVRFDLVWAFSVLMHLEDEILAETLGFVRPHLKPSGAFYANVVLGEKEDAARWDRFPVVYRSVDFYRRMAERFDMKVTDLGALSSLGHHSGIPAQDEQRMLCFRR